MMKFKSWGRVMLAACLAVGMAQAVQARTVVCDQIKCVCDLKGNCSCSGSGCRVVEK